MESLITLVSVVVGALLGGLIGWFVDVLRQKALLHKLKDMIVQRLRVTLVEEFAMPQLLADQSVHRQRKWQDQGLGARDDFSGSVGLLRPGRCFILTPATRQRPRFEFLPLFQDAFSPAEVDIGRSD